MEKLTGTLNRLIQKNFKTLLYRSFISPATLVFYQKTWLWQKKAAKKRAEYEKTDVHVPPVMIISITSRCNLNCAGCYALNFSKNKNNEMQADKFQDIIKQADALGISIIFIAGGEPLLRKDIFSVMSRFPHIIFPVFTNGTMIDKKWIFFFRKNKNIIPLLSIEGQEKETNHRRGDGVYQHFHDASGYLKKVHNFWGISITVTSQNFDLIISDSFINHLIGKKCGLFFFIEYVPIHPGTENMVLTCEQKAELIKKITACRKHKKASFFAFPGDEEQFGGCLAAGRGFVHINPSGSVEPCPFAPYSDQCLEEKSLKQALQSQFLEKVRQGHDKLSETSGGCALWQNREWVQSLLPQKESSDLTA